MAAFSIWGAHGPSPLLLCQSKTGSNPRPQPRWLGVAFLDDDSDVFPNCDALRATKTLFGDGAYLAAYLAARRDLGVHGGGRSPGTDGGDHRGKVTSLELLACCGSGDDVRGSDRPGNGALLRALGSKTRRIRTSRRLAQKDDDTA